MQVRVKLLLILSFILFSEWSHSQIVIGDTIKDYVQFEMEQYVCVKKDENSISFSRIFPESTTNDYARLKFIVQYDSSGRVSRFRSRSIGIALGEGGYPKVIVGFDYDSLGRISMVRTYKSGWLRCFWNKSIAEKTHYFYLGNSTRPVGQTIEVLSGYQKGVKISNRISHMPIYYEVSRCFSMQSE